MTYTVTRWNRAMRQAKVDQALDFFAATDLLLPMCSQPTRRTYNPAGYAIRLTFGYSTRVGGIPSPYIFDRWTSEPAETIQDCISLARLPPASHINPKSWENDPSLWVRHGPDDFEYQPWDTEQARLVLKLIETFPDFESACDRIRDYSQNLSNSEQKRSSEMLAAAERELQDWPPSSDSFQAFYISFELVEVRQAEDEPIEGAEWVIEDKSMIYPTEREDW